MCCGAGEQGVVGVGVHKGSGSIRGAEQAWLLVSPPPRHFSSLKAPLPHLLWHSPLSWSSSLSPVTVLSLLVSLVQLKHSCQFLFLCLKTFKAFQCFLDKNFTFSAVPRDTLTHPWHTPSRPQTALCPCLITHLPQSLQCQPGRYICSSSLGAFAGAGFSAWLVSACFDHCLAVPPQFTALSLDTAHSAKPFSTPSGKADTTSFLLHGTMHCSCLCVPRGDSGDRTKPYLCLSHPNLAPCLAYVILFELLKTNGTNFHDAREEPEQQTEFLAVSGSLVLSSLISRKVWWTGQMPPCLSEVTVLLEAVLTGRHFSPVELLKVIPITWQTPCWTLRTHTWL